MNKDSVKKVKNSFRDNTLSGFNALLPLLVLLFLLSWVLKLVFALIKPIEFFIEPKAVEQDIFTKIIALIIVLTILYLVGFLIRNKAGRRNYERFENRIFKILPGYTWIKETILRFLGTRKAPFTQVALVRPFNNNTYQLAFITESHSGGGYTVFVPTGPNPTSGNIYILPKEQVKLLKMSVDKAMRMVVSCGIDSFNVAEDDDKGYK